MTPRYAPAGLSASAPNRIDLCGGTLDLYPIYILLGGVTTINAAISVKSRVTVTPRKGPGLKFVSQDLNAEMSFQSLKKLETGTPFDLVSLLVKHYEPGIGMDIRTENQAPLGSGLGASSALLVALSSALNRLTGRGFSKEEIIARGADLEARLIGVPTGKQDYYAAMFGGVSAIRFLEGETVRENLNLERGFFERLDDSLVLAFTGKSHFSAENNWAIIKKVVDRDKKTIRLLERIRDLADGMREALLKSDFKKACAFINDEWNIRKRLARGVSTPAAGRMIKAALSAGAGCAKLAGAGGGGCLMALAGPGKREKVVRALEKAGAEILPARIATRGLVIRKS